MKKPLQLFSASCFSFGVALASLSGSVVIFEPDFSGTYTGGGDNQFTNFYQAEGGAYSTVSVVGSRFQFQSNHDPLVSNNPPLQGDNQSAVQLSRNKNSDALPFINNTGIVQFDWRWNDNVWAAADNSILSFQIGENFRTGAFNPAGGAGNGPAFASLSLQARSTDGQFRFIAGGGPGSSNFDLTRDVDGFFNASIFMAFNNSGSTLNITSPSGPYALNTASVAVWIGTTLVWDNYTHATNINTAGDFENIAFGFGNGTNRTFAEAEPFGGTTQLENIVVSTIPEPSTYAALFGLAALALVAYRRRRSA